MPTRFLVTGFGPFGAIVDNPSADLARRCGSPFEILEVSFAAVDAFFVGLDPDSFDVLLMLGVAAGRDRVSIETVARNAIGKTSDVSGVVRGPAPIEPGGPDRIETTWTEKLGDVATGDIQFSDDAGDYLCNYAYWSALARPDLRNRALFLHVTSFDHISAARQRIIVREVVDGIRATMLRHVSTHR